MGISDYIQAIYSIKGADRIHVKVKTLGVSPPHFSYFTAQCFIKHLHPKLKLFLNKYYETRSTAIEKSVINEYLTSIFLFNIRHQRK